MHTQGDTCLWGTKSINLIYMALLFLCCCWFYIGWFAIATYQAPIIYLF